MSGIHFFVQTSKFMFVNDTVATFGQDHGKDIQYIFRDRYFLCPKHLNLVETLLMWEVKVVGVVSADVAVAAETAAQTNWKHKVTSDCGDLITMQWLFHQNYPPSLYSFQIEARGSTSYQNSNWSSFIWAYQEPPSYFPKYNGWNWTNEPILPNVVT